MRKRAGREILSSFLSLWRVFLGDEMHLVVRVS